MLSVHTCIINTSVLDAGFAGEEVEAEDVVLRGEGEDRRGEEEQHVCGLHVCSVFVAGLDFGIRECAPKPYVAFEVCRLECMFG